MTKKLTKKLKYVRTKRRKTKKYKQKGGKLFGFGSDGFVYGDPRPLCVNENIENLSESDLGKIQTQENANKEMNIINLLEDNNILPEEFSKYAILPIKSCEINTKILRDMHPPYTEEWRKDRRGYVPDIFETQGLKHSYQVTYNKGGRNVQTIINEIDEQVLGIANNLTTKEFENYEKLALHILFGLKNVYEGLLLLYRNNLQYGDMRFQNMVEIDNTIKLVDLGSIHKITSKLNTTLSIFIRMVEQLIDHLRFAFPKNEIANMKKEFVHPK